MQKAMRLNDFWRWLPTCRVVAEKQQLRHAAKILNVSPSAVSRTIRLLEDAVGVELFHREGHKLRLTSSGKILLQSVRSAMRLMDEGLTWASSGEYTGAVRVSVPGSLASLTARALLHLQSDHPRLQVYIENLAQTEINQSLLRGEIDLALVEQPIEHEQIEAIRVSSLSHGVCCGSGHALFKGRKAKLSKIQEFAFAVLSAPDQPAADAWPAGVGRTIRLHSVHMRTIMDLCLSGQVLAVLPDILSTRLVAQGKLRRLELSILADTDLFALRRESLTERDLADRVLHAIQKELND